MFKNTSYGGPEDFSGNQILLENNGTEIFFDFTQSFTFGSEFFTFLFPALRPHQQTFPVSVSAEDTPLITG